MSDVKSILRSIETRLTGIEVSIAKIDGRLTGLEWRLGALPTVWTLLGITFTTWALGSSILIFAISSFLRR